MTDADLLTTAQVAAELGLAPRTVQALAHRRGLGRWIGNQRVYSPADVEDMRRRAPVGNHSGRPRTGRAVTVAPARCRGGRERTVAAPTTAG